MENNIIRARCSPELMKALKKESKSMGISFADLIRAKCSISLNKNEKSAISRFVKTK